MVSNPERLVKAPRDTFERGLSRSTRTPGVVKGSDDLVPMRHGSGSTKRLCFGHGSQAMKTVLLILSGLFLAGGLCSCQTARGFGEDLSTLGNRISTDAEEHIDGD
jgi:predicted small secreted protein